MDPITESAPVAPVTEDLTHNPEVITSWRDGLPEEYKNNPTLMDTKSVEDLAKRFLDTKAMVGDSLRMPSGEAGSDDIAAFTAKILANDKLGLMPKPQADNPESMGAVYDSMGRPEDASGYTMAEGSDPEAFGAMAAKAHELGLSKAQLEGLGTAQMALQASQHEAIKATQQEGLSQLKGEWAGAYDQKVTRATAMLDATNAPSALVDAVASGNIGADVLRWVDSLSTQLGAEGAPMAKQLSSVTADTKSQLTQKRDEVTRRLISENLTHAERASLQQHNVKLNEAIVNAS